MPRVFVQWLLPQEAAQQKDSFARLDRLLSSRTGLSRSHLKSAALKVFRPDGQQISLHKPWKGDSALLVTYLMTVPNNLEPYPLPLRILYQDKQVIVLNKPCGLVVHPSKGHPKKTLINALIYYDQNWIQGFPHSLHPLRPGVVHRLDKDTSGVIIVAKDSLSLDSLAQQFAQRTVKKWYLAIVQGVPSPSRGRVLTVLKRSKRHRLLFESVTPTTHTVNTGKLSLSYYRLIAQRQGYSLLLLQPKTGRTHQLRVHLKTIGHPIVGDPLYNKRSPSPLPLLLHAWRLSLTLPNGTFKQFCAPVASRLRNFWKTLR